MKAGLSGVNYFDDAATEIEYRNHGRNVAMRCPVENLEQ